jgi:hypothetical protein
MIDMAMPVPGMDGLWATLDGRIVSCRRGNPRPLGWVGRDGYLVVNCGRHSTPRQQKVHQLVAAAFLGPRPHGFVTRHLDGNKLNNAIGNLAYGTRLDNRRDAARHGTMEHAGEGNPRAKLTTAKVIQIIRAHAAGGRPADLARQHGLSPGHVSNIVHGRMWNMPKVDAVRLECTSAVLDEAKQAIRKGV